MKTLTLKYFGKHILYASEMKNRPTFLEVKNYVFGFND